MLNAASSGGALGLHGERFGFGAPVLRVRERIGFGACILSAGFGFRVRGSTVEDLTTRQTIELRRDGVGGEMR